MSFPDYFLDSSERTVEVLLCPFPVFPFLVHLNQISLALFLLVNLQDVPNLPLHGLVCRSRGRRLEKID